MMFNVISTLFLRMGIINKIRIWEKEDGIHRLKGMKDYSKEFDGDKKLVDGISKEIKSEQAKLRKLKRKEN